MITVNNLCDFHDLYTSLSVTFTYFNGRNKGIISVIIIYYYYHYYYYYYYYYYYCLLYTSDAADE